MHFSRIFICNLWKRLNMGLHLSPQILQFIHISLLVILTLSNGRIEEAKTHIPEISLNIIQAIPGSYLYINGSGFTSNSIIRIVDEGTEWHLTGPPETDLSGRFSTMLRVPNKSPGNYNLSICDLKDKGASATFTITAPNPSVHIDSIHRLDSQTISIHGTGFGANSRYMIYWDSHLYAYWPSGPPKTDPEGSFKCEIYFQIEVSGEKYQLIPENLVVPDSHVVKVIDDYGYSATATLTII